MQMYLSGCAKTLICRARDTIYDIPKKVQYIVLDSIGATKWNLDFSMKGYDEEGNSVIRSALQIIGVLSCCRAEVSINLTQGVSSANRTQYCGYGGYL